jgi:radical SAM protein with 4Fe4S-binding SPASM domain
MNSDNIESNIINPRLQIVAWEITRSCNLFCSHCRASAHSGPYPGELSTEECFKLIDQIHEVGKPIIILSGGEPLLRQDVFEVGRYATNKGFRVVMGTNGTLITREIAAKMREMPLSRISVSIDFPSPELQDNFRGQKGAYEAAITGIENAQKAGIEVQINSTITQANVDYLPLLVDTALKLNAVAFHPFMLVPTGRGKGLANEELSPEDYESTLKWICSKQSELGNRLVFKPTDAPHYYRIARQCGVMVRSGHGRGGSQSGKPTPPSGDTVAGHGGNVDSMNAMTRGCLAGVGYCFISHVGNIQGCGYLDIEAGNIRESTFSKVWRDSSLFTRLRDISNLKGKCGYCEYKRICGGCRARAFETTGDYLASEPYCAYQPARK